MPRLAALPEVEEVGIFAWFGAKGGIQEWNGFTVFPGLMDPYGNDIIGGHAKHFGADVVVSLIDVWVMHNTAQMIAPARWWPWFPSDTQPISARIFQSLQDVDKPLVYSKRTQEMAKNQGLDVLYVPHGIEKDTFRILPETDKRKFFATEKNFAGDSGFRGVDDDTFITVMVAANKGLDDRKAFIYQLGAWTKFAEKKGNVRLYIHTDPTPRFGGLNLLNIVDRYGIKDKVIFPDNYQYLMGFSPEWMATLYNASDLLLSCSKGEGFGIPIIEAQACGLPVLVTDFSSMPELVRWGEALSPITMEWSPGLEAWRAIPNSTLIVQKLEERYAQWKDQEGWNDEDRQRASQAIHDEFDWDTVVSDFWSPLVRGEL